ncbi:hypothetical protein BJ085DRAFT_32202 [Dimargaris cristalligena]|uniref:DEK-C domain-containing protein n=1 Tax=Dimargaris cristalligena TaxID=215637 RepID=A0A4P9ZN16_9FUNG|nr:hypothetical protein BJ085DRAFT_32202 [Dimargaris cristalligena]|eukprot:RKP33922.1 hypothetical protein BJ085DRAFT_32202 [Dimargaris cristalligena]
MGLDLDDLKAHCRRIVQKADLTTTGEKKIRRQLETQLDLESKALDAAPYKSLLSDYIQELVRKTYDLYILVLMSHIQGMIGVVMAPKTEKLAAEQDQSPPTSPTDSKSDEASSIESASPSKSVQTETHNSRSSNPPPESGSDGDLSSVEEEPPPKKQRKAASPNKAPVAKRKPKQASAPASDADQERIKNLKSYFTKCGVRKVWSRELTNLSPKQQIQKLKQMLTELGVEGRPTIEKCKKIAMQRELQAEFEKDAGFNRPTRSSRQAAPSRRLVRKSEDPAPEAIDFSFLGGDVE